MPATNYRRLAQTLVPGWKTTATDGLIEIWSTDFNGVPSADGNQFAEINATQAAALYQTLTTAPGEVITWSLKHRARQGTDVMRVQAGPDGGTLTALRTISDSTSKWDAYSGTYTVPAGQTTTRFSVRVGVDRQRHVTVGNFLDDVSLRSNACVTGARRGDPDRHRHHRSAGHLQRCRCQPGRRAHHALAVSDAIPAGSTFVPGSITVDTGIGRGRRLRRHRLQRGTSTVTVSPGAGSSPPADRPR